MPEQTHQRIDLAKEQLDVALELFFSKRSFVSALTLAGAAEEILGKALVHRNEVPWLEHEHGMVAEVEHVLRGQPYKYNDFLSEKNRVRNATKHMRDASESHIVADMEDEALWMIVRALENYRSLNLPSTAHTEYFSSWFWKNVVGIDYDG
jgi:hypothetical protein